MSLNGYHHCNIVEKKKNTYKHLEKYTWFIYSLRCQGRPGPPTVSAVRELNIAGDKRKGIIGHLCLFATSLININIF